MLRVVNASDAAVKTAIASAPAASARASPRMFGNEDRVANTGWVGERGAGARRRRPARGSPPARRTRSPRSPSGRRRRGARCTAAWRRSGAASPRSGVRRADRPRRSGPGRPRRLSRAAASSGVRRRRSGSRSGRARRSRHAVPCCRATPRCGAGGRRRGGRAAPRGSPGSDVSTVAGLPCAFAA